VSPRRRALVVVLAALVLVAALVVGAGVLAGRGPSVDPAARPAQDVPGPVLLVR